MRRLIKKIFPKNSRVFRLLFKLYDYRFWFPKYWQPVRWPYNILKNYVHYKGEISFIQVGSNNGMSGDPLYNYILNNEWTGILVEPVPYLFEELKTNYLQFSHRLVFENSAIADRNGRLPFYRLQKSDLPGLPVWYDQLGSFNKKVILSHKNRVPYFDELLLEDTVQAITFETLIRKHAVREADIIHIDTEGYDYEIIKLIPFNLLENELIMFEHQHLSDTDYRKAIKLLRKEGYVLGITDVDTIGIRKKLLNKMKAI